MSAEIVGEEDAGARFGRRARVVGGGGDAAPSAHVHAGWDDGPSSGGGSGAAAAAAASATAEEAVSVVRDGDEAAEAAERLIATVSEAPSNVAGRHIATLEELEGEGALKVAASRAEGIDLSLLTASLYPSEALVENDEVVDWELALQTVAAEMAAEAERSAGEV
jgi:hypothetical protein